MKLTKKLFAVLLTFALCLSCAVSASAATAPTTGDAAAKAKVVRTRDTFTSTSSTPLQVVYYTWVDPAQTPKGVVQLTHGYLEHITRYDDLARFLASHGYVVVGQDHLGHGETGKLNNSFGITPDDGAEAMVNDMHKLMELTKAKYPGIPYILHGHSMGSYMARSFCSKWSNEIDGTVWTGTGYIPGEAYLLSPAADVFAQVTGPNKIDTTLNDISAQNPQLALANSGISNPETASDWLSYDSRNVQEYIADPLNVKNASNSLNRDAIKIVLNGGKQGFAESMRKDLPIFIMSGKADGAGGSTGTARLKDQLEQSGMKNVRTKLYDGRHEIHNDFCKDQVYADLLDFCDSICGK